MDAVTYVAVEGGSAKVGDRVARADGQPFYNGEMFATISSIEHHRGQPAVWFRETNTWMYPDELAKVTVTNTPRPGDKPGSRDRQVGGSHYKDMAIQPIDFILKNGLGFCAGNVIKYVTRYKSKNGVEDLKKARHYLDMLIEQEEGQAND